MSGYGDFFGYVPERVTNLTCKAGISGLTMALARKFGKDSITANTIGVRGIKTTCAANQHANEELVRLATERLAVSDFGDCENIEEACIYLAGDSGRFVTGTALHVNVRRVDDLNKIALTPRKRLVLTLCIRRNANLGRFERT